jgi:hypothetical protein
MKPLPSPPRKEGSKKKAAPEKIQNRLSNCFPVV